MSTIALPFLQERPSGRHTVGFRKPDRHAGPVLGLFGRRRVVNGKSGVELVLGQIFS